MRRSLALDANPPTLHMSFTGNPGTGKTTVARRMGKVLHKLGDIQKGHLISVTREDLAGQYVGHTAPKTQEVLKRARGGVLSSTRRTTSTRSTTSVTTARRRWRCCSRSWRTTARTWW